MIIKATPRHPPSTGDRSSARVFGGQQALARSHHRVRRESLPNCRSYIITQYQTGVTALPARLGTRLVGHRTYEEPED